MYLVADCQGCVPSIHHVPRMDDAVQAKGHSAVVRTLRSRLDMPREPSGRLRRNHEGVERTVRGARIPSMNSNDEDDEKRAQEKEIWKSIADLA